MHLPHFPRRRFQDAVRATGFTRAEVAIGGVRAPLCHCGARKQAERAGIERDRLGQD